MVLQDWHAIQTRGFEIRGFSRPHEHFRHVALWRATPPLSRLNYSHHLISSPRCAELQSPSRFTAYADLRLSLTMTRVAYLKANCLQKAATRNESRPTRAVVDRKRASRRGESIDTSLQCPDCQDVVVTHGAPEHGACPLQALYGALSLCHTG